jgi:hypothetical protein
MKLQLVMFMSLHVAHVDWLNSRNIPSHGITLINNAKYFKPVSDFIYLFITIRIQLLKQADKNRIYVAGKYRALVFHLRVADECKTITIMRIKLMNIEDKLRQQIN